MVTVRNNSNRLVTLRLNSGQTLILNPRATAENLMNQEVEGNAKVQKLIDLGVISKLSEPAQQPKKKQAKTHAPKKVLPHKKKGH